ncbi:MAG: hypothetical protein KH259_07805, partial [Haemophilus paraphrohaemolyticus]|nr:hypothetical protein [Haemophilus paraphrohaemolyticus]
MNKIYKVLWNHST